MNVIYNAFYQRDEQIKSPNLCVSGGGETYLKMAFVSLKTAKINNPDCSVVLVTNESLSDGFLELFNKADIGINYVPLKKFIMPSNFEWEFAFYKLEALDYIVSQEKYDNILALDTDTYVNGNLNALWDECVYDIPLLMPLNVGCKSPVRNSIIKDYQKLSHVNYPVTQFGGEFIAGSRGALKIFIENVDALYDEIKHNNFDISENSGDEALISMAMAKESYNNAGSFIQRYWTRRAFYNASSNWEWTPIWHLPAEKNYGLLIMYKYLTKNNKMPSADYAARLFNLPCQNKYSLSMIRYYIYNIVRRLR